MIPLSVPNISELEQKRVAAALASGWVSTGGPEISAFEKEMAQYTGSPNAVALNSGSAALHLALVALEIGKGDIVLVSNFTYTATLNAIAYVGARPVLVDCQAETMQIDPLLVEKYLQEETELRDGKCVEKVTGEIVRAILPVHVLGYPAPVEQLLRIANAHNLVVVEDAAAAVGSFQGGKHLGTRGLIGILSFNGNKVLTTGGGGMLLTPDPKLADTVRHLALQAKSFPTEYIHDRIGYNYGMTNVAAAIGRAQLERLQGFLDRKEEIHQFYRHAFEGTGIRHFSLPRGGGDAFNHWLEVFFHPQASTWSHELEMNRGIQARRLWVPMNRLPMHATQRYLSAQDNAFGIYANGFCLPCASNISRLDLDKVVETVKALAGE